MIKKLLTTILLLGCNLTLLLGDSLAVQQHRVEQVLWYEQKQFGLDQIYITVQVLPGKAMTTPNVWGSMVLSPAGPVIEIRAMEDYTAGMTVLERRQHQKEIVVHEVLHVLMLQKGVPVEAQDVIIEAVRPGVRIP